MGFLREDSVFFVCIEQVVPETFGASGWCKDWLTLLGDELNVGRLT